MRAVVTRVAGASVTIAGNVNGRIGRGFLVLLGVGPNDTEETADRLAEKICNLRVFEDENGKMNLNLEQTGGALLVVSQFTLYADTSSRRPGFTGAAKPDAAIPLYERFMAHCRERGFDVQHGEFGVWRLCGRRIRITRSASSASTGPRRMSSPSVLWRGPTWALGPEQSPRENA